MYLTLFDIFMNISMVCYWFSQTNTFKYGVLLVLSDKYFVPIGLHRKHRGGGVGEGVSMELNNKNGYTPDFRT